MSYRIPWGPGFSGHVQIEGEINQGLRDDLPILRTSYSIAEYGHWQVPTVLDHHSRIEGQERQHVCA
jgi:hypothetical protein